MRGCVFGMFLLAALPFSPAHAIDWDTYVVDPNRYPIDLCRHFPSSIKLSDDQRILCFDGAIAQDQNLSVLHRLKQDGIFVMRSPGGYAREAMTLSNILREKAATVLLYDYCLSACANYVLVATNKTYVTKDTVVAWHGGPWSPDESQCSDSGREQLRRSYADRYGAEGARFADVTCQTGTLSRSFFKDRQIDDRHIYKPQTEYTKKMMSLALKETDDPRSVFWMWNPINYRDYFKSRIVFEKYPENQSEVNDLLSRFSRSRFGSRYIFDP